jgi:antitoxin component YwqK of YwqJK toxin-antitoxin module
MVYNLFIIVLFTSTFAMIVAGIKIIFLKNKNDNKETYKVDISYYRNGQKGSEVWYNNDKNSKVEITYYRNGQKESEEWYKNNKLHRMDTMVIGGRPAVQHWYEDGNIESEEWYKNGKLHRIDGRPAVQRWYENGNKKNEEWYKKGKRIGGPLIQFKEPNIINTITIDGKEISEETILKALKNYFK